MRIAMVGQKGIPARYGGVERAVEELSACLVERGHEVTAFNRREDGDVGVTMHRGIRLVPVRATDGKYSGNLTQSFSSVLRVLRPEYDIVHFHAMGPSLFAPLARLGSARAVVSTIQGRDDQRAKWNWAAKALLSVAAWSSAKVPHEVIAVSRQLQRELERDFGRTAHHIPNGVTIGDRPTGGPVTDVAERLGLDGARYFLGVGRLVPEKAMDDAIRALGKTDLDVRLVIVGGSSHTTDFVARLEGLAADDDRIVLAGPVYGEEVDDLFAGASAFVMPSRLEGLPLALLEAISYRLPTIVSDIPPHLEVVGQDGPGSRVFEAGDVDALARSMELTVADLPCVSSICRENEQRIREEYSWECITSLTEDVYRRALKRA